MFILCYAQSEHAMLWQLKDQFVVLKQHLKIYTVKHYKMFYKISTNVTFNMRHIGHGPDCNV